MKIKTIFCFTVLLLVISVQNNYAQNRFRSGRFFHHSTGENIWGPNGSSTSVSQEMARYNTQHGYTGENAVSMNETWFPVNYDNEWAIWHTIFVSNDPENISSYFSSNKIIMVKSCFPSSAIEEFGQPIDTLSPEYKTIYNYKWHWRNIVRVMKNNPQIFFVIWTNAPLTQSETTPTQAYLSKQFCKWAKDTLATGRDPVFGVFPNNVYVFCFFSKLTDANGYLLPQYAVAPNDPHPNANATALVAPLLVNEVFDHSIAYEQVFGIQKLNESVPAKYMLNQNYPNPFNPVTFISFSMPERQNITLQIYEVTGRLIETLVNYELSAGYYKIDYDASKLASGVYYYVLTAGEFRDTKKMLLLK